MIISQGLMLVSFYSTAFSLTVPTLAYETDPTEELAFFCPGYSNCTHMNCRYNRIVPVFNTKPFNKSDIPPITCDSLEVNFTSPKTTDESFVGNESWTCYRYYDAIGHHFAILKITLNKPSDLSGTQVQCTASIGNCTLFNETSSEMIFIAGLPNNCVEWTGAEPTEGGDDTTTPGTDPTEEPAYFCPGYSNCTHMDCRYNRIVPVFNTMPFNKSDIPPLRCDSLEVNFTSPETTDEAFVGNETWACYRYYDAKGHHFAVLKISLNKPSDLNGNQVQCTTSIGNCTLFNETSSTMIFIAGLPNSCVKWTGAEPTEGGNDTTTPAEPDTKKGQSGISTRAASLEISTFLAMIAVLFIRHYL